MNRVLRELPFWTGHGLICAAPSFKIAYHNSYNTSEAVTGMAFGVLVVVCFYSLLSSTRYFSIRNKLSRFSRSLRRAAHLRAFLGVAALAGTLTPGFQPLKKPSPEDGAILYFIEIMNFLELITGVIGMRVSIPLINKIGTPIPGTLGTFITTISTAAVFSIVFLLIAVIFWFFSKLGSIVGIFKDSKA